MIRFIKLIILTVLSVMFCSTYAFTVLPPKINHQMAVVSAFVSSTSQQQPCQFPIMFLDMADPAVLEPEVNEKKDTKDDVDEEQKHGTEAWEVRLYNDPMNKREFVARCLTQITGLSDTAAYQVMMQAHNHGLAVVGRYAFEIAELYHDSLREQGLYVDMIQVDDE
mmetsp:Transcript_9935/g.14043  ORF Transcript_9935/g.14043 Transcript_9935/m.14043 type:complete len:166 (+) Transcript_9935:169-666(+)